MYRPYLEQARGSPGVVGRPRSNPVLVSRLDRVQSLLPVADRAAEDKEAVIDQPLERDGMLSQP